MFEKVLVAIDASDQAEKILRAAGELATKAGTELRLLHVQELHWGARSGSVPMEEQDDAEKIVNDAVAKLQASGVTASGVLRSALTSRISHEIVEEAEESGCSAIMTGSRGMSGLEGALIGSVSNKLLHLVEMPVIVIR